MAPGGTHEAGSEIVTDVVPLSHARVVDGAKAAHLAWLIEHGFDVPPGIVTSEDPSSALEDWIDPTQAYAVRSSASVEDSPEFSFAGQFRTVLGVVGLDAVREAVAAVQSSARDPRVLPYLRRADIPPDDVRMNVIVQQMVPAAHSGVAFSRNPLTGLTDIMVEATSGTSDDLVSGRTTPERWVWHWGDWTAVPGDPATPEPVVRRVVALVERAADAWGSPIDIEWAWDGERVWLLQIRPMTVLDVPVYSNRLSKEFLPGMVSPLVWSVNVPVVNRAWLELFTSLVGPLELQPEDLSRQFAYRAYFNMKAIGDIFEAVGMPRDLLEVLIGVAGGVDRPSFRPGPSVARHLPRMARMAGRLIRYERELDRRVPVLQRELAAVEQQDPASLSDTQLVDRMGVLERLVQEAAFANIVAPLLLNAYGSLLRRRLSRRGIDPHATDFTAGYPGLEAYDPTPHLQHLSNEVDRLGEQARAMVLDGEIDVVPGARAFLERFGHVSDSGNDFSRVPWREDPTQLAPLLLGGGREATVSDGGGREATVSDGGKVRQPSLSGPDRTLMRKAQRFRWERERVSYTYTRGYGLFRPTVQEIARRLVDRGVLHDPDDVFMLSREEMERALLGGDVDPVQVSASERRNEMQALADVDMPEVIFGDDFRPAPPSDPERTLDGTPSARGIVTGRARVVRGVADAGRVSAGDVVVIPYSDVGWTPMLARAGAVVAESGGLLSHSSIVAREFGIPCVVSVAGAMRIPEGASVRVDGYSGSVQWEDPR